MYIERINHLFFAEINFSELTLPQFSKPLLKNDSPFFNQSPFVEDAKKHPSLQNLNLEASTPQNGQTHSNNSSAIAEKCLSVFDNFVGLALKRSKVQYLSISDQCYTHRETSHSICSEINRLVCI